MKYSIDKKTLKQLVKTSKSFRDIERKTGIPRRIVQLRVKEFGIDYSSIDIWKDTSKMIGKRYNYLTVVRVFKDFSRKSINKNFCECECKCGKTIVKRVDALKSGRAISCGCHVKHDWCNLSKDGSDKRFLMTGSKNGSFNGYGEMRSQYYGEIKYRAKQRGLEFNVSKKYLWELFLEQKGLCALTKKPIKFGRIYYRNETTASLDRIDNEKGYIIGNVRWVIKPINMMRRDLDTDFFIELCRLVADANPR